MQRGGGELTPLSTTLPRGGMLPELYDHQAIHGARITFEPGPRAHILVRPHSPGEAVLRLAALPRPARTPRPYRGEFNSNTRQQIATAPLGPLLFVGGGGVGLKLTLTNCFS